MRVARICRLPFRLTVASGNNINQNNREGLLLVVAMIPVTVTIGESHDQE